MPDTLPLRCASAVSTAADLERAIDEVCHATGQQLDGPPDLAVLFVSVRYESLPDRLAARTCSLLGTQTLIGSTAEAVLGTGRELETEPAVSLWAAQLGGVPLLPMHLQLERTADGSSIVGWPRQLDQEWPAEPLLLILGDPFSFPADVMLERLNEDRPGLRVAGGMASGAPAPGDARLLLADRVVSEGAVGVLLSGAEHVRTVVSQGCRPIGRHLVVTRSEGNVIQQLGGQPALIQLKSIFDTLPTSDQQLVQRGLHLGRVVSEYQDRFEQGDFLVRNVIGIDPNDGSIAVGDFLRPGQTVQFHVRDAQTADQEMRHLLARARDDSARAPQGGLLFTCNGRGTRLFREPHHDAQLIQHYFGDIPLAGFFAGGEFGPIGGKNFVHGFTASAVLFS